MEINQLIESLSPIEQKLIPHLSLADFEELVEKSGLDKISALRALEFLNAKNIIKLSISKEQIVELGTNGIYYKKKGLPERQLIYLLEKKPVKFQDAQKQASLSSNEFQASLGALKKKAMLEIRKGTIFLTADKEEITKKTLEEQLIESLPKKYKELQPEELHALKSLKERKDIVQITEKQLVEYSLTTLGKELIKQDISFAKNLVESLTPEMIKSGAWKGKKFRRYDVTSPVPKIYGGKRHFVNQATDYGRKVWTEMGFKEMTGNMIQSSFWNFDALFTAQDHPVREMQDTFFINKTSKLPDKELVEKVKKAHESGVGGSKGWQYTWSEDEAKKLVLRTHTTCLSAQTLSKLKLKDLPIKFFAMGVNFRNETVDWNHGFELLQTEGIVVDENANFRHLLGYLKEFARKMGFEKIRFRPAYFPYTEPSVEGDVWNEEKKEWVEYIAAGVFRPEVTIPLLGKPIPVLAWGPGFGRMLTKFYDIKDLRELWENDLTKLRKMKYWSK